MSLGYENRSFYVMDGTGNIIGHSSRETAITHAMNSDGLVAFETVNNKHLYIRRKQATTFHHETGKRSPMGEIMTHEWCILVAVIGGICVGMPLGRLILR